MKIPHYLFDWFKRQGWKMHPYQKKLFAFFEGKESVLLIAPTGGGKTLASFLPSLMDIHHKKVKQLHTLYISPLKALTADIQRNLYNPINEMGLSVTVDARTGDTSSYRRLKQKRSPPTILLTTPESLMLLLSYPDAKTYFSNLQSIIIDELHSFVATKRGDMLSLCLAQLANYSPSAMRIGLSATVANPEYLAKWLGGKNKNSQIIVAKTKIKPDISLLLSNADIPYGGFMAKYAVNAIYKTILNYKLSIIFVNTRAQAEFLFQQLWQVNNEKLPIAIYHGSLNKEHRAKVEKMVYEKNIRAIVATSALELGIDWGDIDCVMQVGAPRGISRLVQRVGRSNHNFSQPSVAKLVPANCFDTVECQAAINAIAVGKLDSDEFKLGSLDVIVQFIINSACSQAVQPKKLYHLIQDSYPYHQLKYNVFEKLFEFAVNGGYVLKHYDQYHRLKVNAKKQYEIASIKAARRHRQNIGTIVESAKLYVKLKKARSHNVLGEIEENFAQQLNVGDSFMFAGQILTFERIRDMFVEASRTKAKEPKLPSYLGGTMPLSTYLAEEVRGLINTPKLWQTLPSKVIEWLTLQSKFSKLPGKSSILVEQYPYKKNHYLTIYSFEGRQANHTLGMLITKRMENLGLLPINFTVTDYGLCIGARKQISFNDLNILFNKNILKLELEDWLNKSNLLKRTFRQVAIISGLIERKLAGKRKTLKQVTFSTDLIYDVLKRYEPEHILLQITRTDLFALLLDLERLQRMLERFENRLDFVELSKPSPMAISILTTFNTENIHGNATLEILSQVEKESLAIKMIEDVRQSVEV